MKEILLVPYMYSKNRYVYTNNIIYSSHTRFLLVKLERINIRAQLQLKQL